MSILFRLDEYHEVHTPPNKKDSYTPDPSYILQEDKKYAIKAAREIGYTSRFPHIVNEIKEAKTPIEVSRIMATYRKKFFGD